MKMKKSLALKLIAAGILIQTLYFKFTGASESVYIFSTLGIEPWGRWFSGICELIASLLILIPATSIIGAFLAIGIMGGAIMSHLLILGVVIQNDGGLLFGLAWAVLLASAGIILIHKNEIPTLIKNVRARLHVSSN